MGGGVIGCGGVRCCAGDVLCGRDFSWSPSIDKKTTRWEWDVAAAVVSGAIRADFVPVSVRFTTV